VYSPDGKFIAFVAKPNQEPPLRNVHIFPLSGGEARSFRVPSKNHWNAAQDFNWLPDGSGVSFTGETSSETPGMEASTRHYGLFHLDLESGVWQAQEVPGESWSRCEWRGDGQGFFYSCMSSDRKLEIFDRDLQTGTDRLITDESGFLLRCSRDYKSFASTRDGKIKIMDAKTGEILMEFDNLGLPPLGRPSWSPDGKKLVLWGGDNNSYHVISCADGTSQEFDISESLPEGSTGGFDWSPLGDQMAFAFKFNQWDTYLITNVTPEDKK
jgi:Tol biopolymer transport system component